MFTLYFFLNTICPGSDTRPTQVVNLDAWPAWYTLSNLIVQDQQGESSIPPPTSLGGGITRPW